MHSILFAVLFNFAPCVHADRVVHNTFACAGLLETGVVKPADHNFDRTFGQMQRQAHRKMQAIFRRAARGFTKITTLLELTGRWRRQTEVNVNDRGLEAIGDSVADQRRLKTISYRLWRVHARTPMYANNLVAVREVIVGEAAIRRRLQKIRAAATRAQMRFDEAEAAPAGPRRANPWRVGADVLAVTAASALSFYNLTSLVHLAALGHYVMTAVHAGIFYFVARPVLTAKAEALWQAFRGRDSSPDAAATLMAHFDEVSKTLKSKSKRTFSYFGSTIDLDLRKSQASTHPWRRNAPFADEVLAAAIGNKGRPAPRDHRTLEVDAVFRFDEELNDYVYAIHAWEPQYSTESKWWGW